MSFVKKRLKEVVLGMLILSNLVVWTLVHEKGVSKTLSVYFLDVGQGDAILIDSPTHGRMLVDGGVNRQVISHLGKTLPFQDKRIDVVLATHPDKDHIGGLPEVFASYDVGAFISPDVESDSSLDDELDSRVSEEKSVNLLAKRGMVINFGDGVKFEILFPNQDISRWDTNDASIVGKLSYGETTFLLTGDSGLKTENILISNPDLIDVDVLKAGHHGSRTSTSLAFASLVTPEYTIISAGKDNSYGHPHKEVLDTLEKVGSKVLSTAEEGTITVETDGHSIVVK